MFNGRRKREFLEQLGINNQPFVSLFSVTEPYEAERGYDLAEFTTEDFTQVLADTLGLTQSSLRMSRQRINKYLAWCREKNYPTKVIGSIEMSPDKSTAIHQRMVGSPEDLSSRMDRIFHDRTIATVDCLHRCYLWMLFMGFDKEEPPLVKTSEVELASFRIVHNGDLYDIPPTALADFMHAVNATEFVHAKSIQKGNNTTGKRVDSPYLLRGLRTEQLSMETLQRTVTSLQKRYRVTGDKIVPKQVRVSGFFWRAYLVERKGAQPYLTPLIEDTFGGTTYIGDRYSKPSRDYYRYLTFKYRQDYEAWKQAFHLT